MDFPLNNQYTFNQTCMPCFRGTQYEWWDHRITLRHLHTKSNISKTWWKYGQSFKKFVENVYFGKLMHGYQDLLVSKQTCVLIPFPQSLFFFNLIISFTRFDMIYKYKSKNIMIFPPSISRSAFHLPSLFLFLFLVLLLLLVLG